MALSKKIISILIFLICLLSLSLPMIRSGLNYSYGIGFWGPNAHDGIWHLSLINHINNPFKINIPIFSGELLKNYHPFYNILISFLSRISQISASFWLFQIMPVLMSFLILYLSYLIGKKITASVWGGMLLVFLNTFSTSFGWIITLLRQGSFGGESLFWSMQSFSTQLNPPFALSLVFIQILIYFLITGKIAKYNPLPYLVIFILLIITPITKVYGGLTLYLIFGFYSLFQIFKSKNFKPVSLLTASLIPAYLLFSLYNSSSGNLIIFQPLWFVNSMIESQDRLYLPQLANMRYTLEASGRLGPRLIAIYLSTVAIFIIGNFSWRILGLVSLIKSKTNYPYLWLPIIVLTFIPLFFIQQGTSWNTIQFLYYALFLANIFLLIFFRQISDQKYFTPILLLIISTSLLGNIGNFQNYLGNPAPAAIPKLEIQALNFLSTQTSGNVMTYPYDSYQKLSLKAPIPISSYETTAYVSAYGLQSTYLSDIMNLQNSAYNWSDRLDQTHKFFNTSTDINQARGILVNNQIDYIYLVGNQLNLKLDTDNLYLKAIFDNGYVRIYQVER